MHADGPEARGASYIRATPCPSALVRQAFPMSIESRRTFTAALVVVASVSALPSAASAQLSWVFDLSVRTRYQWRGLVRYDSPVVQPALELAYTAGPARLTAGGWTTVAADGSPDGQTGMRLARAFAGETNVWIEAAPAAGPLDVGLGWVRYTFADRAGYRPAPGRDSDEIYLRARLLDVPRLVPEILIVRDIGEVRGTWAQVGLTLLAPLWAAIVIPVGSLELGVTSGYSFSQHASADRPGRVSYFDDEGFTHTVLRAAVGGGGVPTPFHTLAWRLDAAVQLNHDDALRRMPGDAADASRFEAALTLSFAGPRCRPEVALCGP